MLSRLKSKMSSAKELEDELKRLLLSATKPRPTEGKAEGGKEKGKERGAEKGGKERRKERGKESERETSSKEASLESGGKRIRKRRGKRHPKEAGGEEASYGGGREVTASSSNENAKILFRKPASGNRPDRPGHPAIYPLKG